MTDNEKKINKLKYIFSQTLEITQTTTVRTKTFHRYSSMVKPRGITSFIANKYFNGVAVYLIIFFKSSIFSSSFSQPCVTFEHSIKVVRLRVMQECCMTDRY